MNFQISVVHQVAFPGSGYDGSPAGVSDDSSLLADKNFTNFGKMSREILKIV